MGILSWIIMGLLAGALAKLIMPGDQSNNWLTTMLLGILGGLIGGFIGSALGFGGIDGFTFRSLLLAVGGALLVLWIYISLSRKRA